MSRRKEKFADKPQKEFDEVMLEVRRVTRVTTGGRQLSFRAIILVGNRKGKIGIGIAKWADVQIAVSKATRDAYKNVVDVPLTEKGTIPYQVANKYKGAQVKLIPAAPGTGLKAGSSVRMVLDLVGCTNILSKIMGSPNKLNNALATVEALWTFKVGKFPERVKKNATVATEELGAEEKWTEPAGDVAVVAKKKSAVAPKNKESTPKKPVAKKITPKKDA
jgi:small subunit ribosomal protein S5